MDVAGGRGGTEQPLAGIAEQGMQIADAASETTALGEEQVVGLSEVNSAVNQMDQVTIQNAEMVEDATAADRSLCKEIQRLGDHDG